MLVARTAVSLAEMKGGSMVAEMVVDLVDEKVCTMVVPKAVHCEAALMDEPLAE